jgi:hypothetical protein
MTQTQVTAVLVGVVVVDDPFRCARSASIIMSFLRCGRRLNARRKDAPAKLEFTEDKIKSGNLLILCRVIPTRERIDPSRWLAHN